MAVIEYHHAGNSEAQQQQALAYLLAQAAPGRATAGVLSGLTVSQTATASGAVLVAPGAAVAQVSSTAGAGLLVNDAQATLNVLTGTGSTPMGATPRNDIVWIDRATLSVGYTAGAPNAVPTDPTVPATAVRIARLRHAANATTIPASRIDDLRTFTSLLGVSDDTDWVTTGGSAKPGWTVNQFRYRIRNGLIEVYLRVSNTTPITGTSSTNIADVPVLQLPEACIPSGWGRALAPGTPGPLAGWYVGADGVVSLTAVPNATFAAGSEWTATGTYLRG